MTTRELWEQRRGTILVTLLALAAAVAAVYLMTRENSPTGQAAQSVAVS